MEESEVNMDSFVDIVANTVGMVIILTLLTIATSDNAGLDLNQQLKAFNDLKIANKKAFGEVKMARAGFAGGGSGTVQRLDSIEKAQEVLAKVSASRDSLGRSLAGVRSRRASSVEKGKGLESRLRSLAAKRTEYATAISVAGKSEGQLASEIPGFDASALVEVSLSNMKAGVKGLESEVASITDEARVSGATLRRRKKQADELEKEEKLTSSVVKKLRRDAEIEVEVTTPPSRRDYSRVPIWIECYAAPGKDGPEKQLRVMLVDDKSFKREEGTLTPTAEGETTDEIRGEKSDFRTFLAGKDKDFKRSHLLHFIVRPDAYAAFRDARGLAREAGWDVDWSPIEGR